MKGILISCKQKNHLFKIFKCNSSTENEIIYKNYKNKLTHVIRQSKMIKLQTDFDLSTIIEKRGRCPDGGGANILGGRCPGGQVS